MVISHKKSYEYPKAEEDVRGEKATSIAISTIRNVKLWALLHIMIFKIKINWRRSVSVFMCVCVVSSGWGWGDWTTMYS